jgi:tRNA threonylcarbamoyladenosine biosynthesis protein TsaB
MALILNIETATQICSTCLSRDGHVIAIRETTESNSHALLLGTFIQELFSEAGLTIDNLDAVAVSSGPGSYTGLRIGVSMAKGICYSRNIPLIAIPTLEAMAMGMRNKCDADYLVPMIDAGRMEVYSAVFDQNIQQIRKDQPQIIDQDSFSEEVKNGSICYFGGGAPKCKEVIERKNVSFKEGGLPTSNSMAGLAEKYYNANHFADTAYFEPFYLKEFQAKISKVKGLE